jgi:serine/threonine protein kinase
MALQSTVRGTLGFMAPELLGYFEANSSHCPQPADIWSVEEITFQMLTRRPMFQNLAQLNNYIQRPQTFPSSSLLGLDETGVDFIRSLMVPEPHKRLTATAALSHDWLSHYKLTTARPSTGFVHSLRSTLYMTMIGFNIA